jgi:hypothetical protein
MVASDKISYKETPLEGDIYAVGKLTKWNSAN